MKVFFASLLMTSVFLCSPANAETIFEALGEAYNSNPDLQAQRAYLRGVDENVAIAKSGYRPSVDLVGSYTDVDRDGGNSTYSTGGIDRSMAATITQPIFNGLQTYNSVRSADSLVRSEQFSLSNFEQQIFLNASTAYLNVVRDMAILQLQKNNERLLKKQLDETTERFNVGELTRTDVAQSKSSYSQAVANRISAEGNLEVSKAVYLQIVGKKPEDLSEPSNIHLFLPAGLDQALSYAHSNNFGILQAKELLNSKEYDVKAKTGALLPQVNASGSASKNKSNQKTLGVSNGTIDNLELGVNMSIPLYDAGENRAKIRQSKYAKWQAHEQLLGAQRAATANVTGYWKSMVANDAMIKALQDRVNANEIALDGVKKEESLGNRTIIDVLDAFQVLLDSQVQVIKAKQEYYLSSLQVMQSMGKLTAKDLALNVNLYNAKKHYKDTKDKWLSISVD